MPSDVSNTAHDHTYSTDPCAVQSRRGNPNHCTCIKFSAQAMHFCLLHCRHTWNGLPIHIHSQYILPSLCAHTGDSSRVAQASLVNAGMHAYTHTHTHTHICTRRSSSLTEFGDVEAGYVVLLAPIQCGSRPSPESNDSIRFWGYIGRHFLRF